MFECARLGFEIFSLSSRRSLLIPIKCLKAEKPTIRFKFNDVSLCERGKINHLVVGHYSVVSVGTMFFFIFLIPIIQLFE